MQAIPLARHDFREYDEIITLYTKEAGKIDVLARGVKKSTSKQAAYLEPFFLIEAEWVGGRGGNRLVRAYPLEHFAGLAASLTALQLVAYSRALLNRVVSAGEPDRPLFALALDWWRFLAGGFAAAPLLDAFILKVWSRLGFTLVTGRCVECGAGERAALYPAGGGFVCQSCAAEKTRTSQIVLPLSPAALSVLPRLLAEPFEELSETFVASIPGLHEAVMAFAMYHSQERLPVFGGNGPAGAPAAAACKPAANPVGYGN